MVVTLLMPKDSSICLYYEMGSERAAYQARISHVTLRRHTEMLKSTSTRVSKSFPTRMKPLNKLMHKS